ncbi:uncharacterized protein UV8b_00281 [Ustilaginoidea virens]|uniref:Uncharacterized protein n=1 Tax=Ustilaginoidea virens TaxID=1159556 RepID=A0A8E5HIG4_USTVR|nr:uncharacterized protein UV8b_00281 [Ustilaginoidea virens]QUC16040.1 hypothetical protein UV8b_00281 [Ustilaginoidea virens]
MMASPNESIISAASSAINKWPRIDAAGIFLSQSKTLKPHKGNRQYFPLVIPLLILPVQAEALARLQLQSATDEAGGSCDHWVQEASSHDIKRAMLLPRRRRFLRRPVARPPGSIHLDIAGMPSARLHIVMEQQQHSRSSTARRLQRGIHRP